jgi:hypothetical protein
VEPGTAAALAWALRCIAEFVGMPKKKEAAAVDYRLSEADRKMDECFRLARQAADPAWTPGAPVRWPNLNDPAAARAWIRYAGLGYNFAQAKKLLLEFVHAPPEWRQRLRVCTHRGCGTYFVHRSLNRRTARCPDHTR